MKEFDYIIIGAGSAGCVLARRLAEANVGTILVLEAGPNDQDWRIQMPSGYGEAIASGRFSWQITTEPEAGLNNRTLAVNVGRVVGGSSSINGMIYAPGCPIDFDLWHQRGLQDWSYRHVLPYFRRAENFQGPKSEFRGAGGPLDVSIASTSDPLATCFLTATDESGFPRSADIFGADQIGFQPAFRTIRDGVRWSAANAYLRPALATGRIQLETDIVVERIVFEDLHATAVIASRGRSREQFSARKEIILSSGALHSPLVLQRSGVGPADLIKSIGVDVVKDLKGVGANLQEHPTVPLTYHANENASIAKETRLLRRYWNGARWMLTKSGICATNHWNVIGLIKTNEFLDAPDVTVFLIAIAKDNSKVRVVGTASFEIDLMLCRPHSRGYVRATGPRPSDRPAVKTNMLTDERDIRGLIESVKMTNRILSQPSFAPISARPKDTPSSFEDDAIIEQFIRQNTYQGYHFSCTCSMGVDPSDGSVVDAQGRVHGVRGLRVVDASIMPSVTSTNTNAPTIMIAEKISDDIIGRSAHA